MAELNTEDLRIRQFLLGELGDDEREQLEQRVLIEGGTRDKLLMAEDDLIEEYLEGALQDEEREKFLRQFLSIPHQRNKLRIAKSLRRFARDEANFEANKIESRAFRAAGIDTTPIEPVPTDHDIGTLSVKAKTNVFPHVLFSRPARWVYAPIALAVLMAIAIGAVWYARYRSNIERQAQRQAIERELALLNFSGAQNVPPDQVFTITLPPVSTRSVEANISSDFKGPLLELWLIPATQQAVNYNAVFQKVGSGDMFQVPNLQLQERAGNKAIRLRVPTRLLTPGLYRVKLTAISPGGVAVDTSEYSLEIH